MVFNRDITHTKNGTIVRDDNKEPFWTIIKSDNGNFVLESECVFALTDFLERMPR